MTRLRSSGFWRRVSSLFISRFHEEKNEKEAILEALVEGVISIDAQGRIRYVNFMASRMLGIGKRHLLGNDIAQIPSNPLLEKCRFLLYAAAKKGFALTDSFTIGEAKRIYFDLIAVPKTHGKGAIVVMQDKSSHHRVLEMGKEFVSNASHELRTPITIIKGFVETLQDMPGLPSEMTSDIIEKIARNCQRMDKLVKNLLTLADIENLPKSRFQECDLIALIEDCRQVVLAVYPSARIIIDKRTEPLTAYADPEILELAILNLMDNAAKYSNPPAHITITIDEKGDEAVIAIADKGIGIAMEEAEHIFDRFYTVNKARSRRLGGAGLGLSIVKTIVDRHEGIITVNSVLGCGTEFQLRLPMHHMALH